MSNFDPRLWKNNFLHLSPLFSPLEPAYHLLGRTHDQWPTLADYNQTLHTLPAPIYNNNGKIISFVDQNTDASSLFESHYEPRIFLRGEIQTRLTNWHDFFQVLVWSTWPKTKALLNELHYKSAIKRSNKQRSPIENFVTLFDECGIVILSSDPDLFTLIEDFQWQQLFCENRDEFKENISCITFGHAMYEKALNPYIGMTAQALLIQVESSFLANYKNPSSIDSMIVKQLTDQKVLEPRILNPFPLLGVPSWYENQDSTFYENTDYFRPGRRKCL